MIYDCIVIGGGLAGLTAGIRCAEAGLSCALVSGGMSALHFASGSIDLLGRLPGDEIVRAPFAQLPGFLALAPEHPYNRCGLDGIFQSLLFFSEQLNHQGMVLCRNGDRNHFHLTTYGTLTPTFLSQGSVYSPELEAAYGSERELALVSFEGFRDFQIPLISSNLPQHPLFRSRRITSGVVQLSDLVRTGRNPSEFRSIDISRMFEAEETLQLLADRILEQAGSARIIGLPACLGFIRHSDVFARLREITGRLIYEIPTLPPSILGMRLDHALKSRFSELGGVLISGDKAVGGRIEGGRLLSVATRNHERNQLQAAFFVLAGGSFFSGGLISSFSGMHEPVFGLKLSYEKDRRQWASDHFFQPQGHAFLEFGVQTNECLNPCDQGGRVIENLYCAGAILAGYNPVREGSGGGVAISTGYHAAGRILESFSLSGAGGS